MSTTDVHRGRSDPSAEGGFTLVELLITIVILTLITGTLGAVFMTAMRTTTNNSETVHASNDAQLIAAFLVRDAQSAGGTNAVTGLIDPTLGVSVNWIAEHGGNDPDPAVCTESNPDQLLIRFSWRDYVSSTTSHVHLAKYYYVSPSGNAAGQIVRLTCVDSAQESEQALGTHVGTPPPVAACVPSSDCPGLPDLVELTVTEAANTLTPSRPYAYTVRANVRASNDVPSSLSTGGAAPVPVLALGGNVCITPGNTSGFGDGGSSITKIYGGVAVDDGGANGCSAINFFGNKYNYTAAGAPQVLNLPDPYASLTPPSQPCTRGVGSNPTPNGGVYPSGVYPQPLPAGATLASGVFVLCNDVPTGLTGTGVLLYLEQGAAITWNGNANTTTSLTAPDSGPYAGIAIWQDKSNTTPLVVNGGAALTLGPTPSGLGSGIYAPTAALELIGNADVSFGWVVAQAIVVSGNHKVTVGVPPATLPAITGPASLPIGLVGKTYTSTQINASVGTGGLEFSATGLPSGLFISPGGAITGTPASPCTCTVVVTVTDNVGDVAKQAYSLVVNATPTISSVTVLRNGNTQVSQGAQNAQVTINGSGFQSGATVTVSAPPDVTTTAPPTISATTITFDINVSATAATGPRDITVTNPDGGTFTEVGALSVSTAPTIGSVTLANGGGGAAGVLNAGDTITVVFSSQMSVASICSAWSNDGSNQNLPTGNGNVTITVTNNGAASGNDSLAVGSSQCALNFGTIDLGSSNYVSATADFSGNGGGNKPTITWTASTKTLAITLGVRTSGAVGSAIASSAPIFSASTAITDSWGGPLSNATFPLANRQQF
jgi:type II secretory pathway pseudopilin PulG